MTGIDAGTPVHPRISLSELSSWNWTLDEDLAFYEREGITTIGASIVKLEAAGWKIGAHRIADAGMRVTNLIGVGPLQLADRSSWDEQRDRMHRALEAARILDAECVVLTTGPAAPLTWEQAADEYAEAIEPVLAEAGHLRVPMAVEHTNSLRVDAGFLHTLRDAVDLARRVGVGVCLDVNACWAERGLDETIRSGVDLIRLVQVSDAAVGTKSTPNRLVPGDGDIPLPRIVGSVLEAGYDGVFDLEFIGPRIEDEGYPDACRRAIDHVGALLGTLGA
jgi:sugar phosphate isomerase/epimerase